jgi:hypothetical protein
MAPNRLGTKQNKPIESVMTGVFSRLPAATVTGPDCP